MISNELSDNPYVVGPPVTGENLYGRQDIFQFIQESLTDPTNQVIVLHGQRRVGKSSILQELHLHRLSYEQYNAVQIDMQGQAQMPFNTVVHNLTTHIAEALEMTEPELVDYQENENYFIQTFLPEVLTLLGNRRLVIMIDEFDALAGDKDASSYFGAGRVGARLLLMLQAILDDSKFDKVIFVLAIGRSLEKLPSAFTLLIQDARFSRIWLLSRADTETLITKPASGMLTYETEAIDRIWHYTSGHPYFTQLLCYEVFNRAKRRQQRQVKARDVEQIIDIALETGGPVFVWLWDTLTIAERLFVSAVGSASFERSAVQKEDIQEILNENRIRLANVDLVEAAKHLARERVLQFAGEDGYRFEVELVRQWVKKNHILNQEKLKISEMSRTAVSAYNVAKRTHGTGKLEAAIVSYRLALQDNPNHFNAQLGLAQALWENGNLEEAVDEFEGAYWLNEEASREALVGARMALAEHLEKEEQYVEATVHYRRIHELAPDYHLLQEKLRAFYDKGEQARSRGDSAEATEFFERVVDIDPNYKDAQAQRLETLYSLGQEAEQVGEWSKAVRFYERVTEIDREYKDAVQRRQDCEAKVNDTKEEPVSTVPSPPRSRSLMPIIVAVVALLLIGGIGGWWIWGGGSTQATPTSTQAIVVDIDDTPTSTPTLEPTETPTDTPAPEPTDTPTPEEPTSTPTLEPTETPTDTPAPEPTDTPTATPSPTPSATPTPEPVPLPTGEALDIDINPQNPATLFALLKSGAVYRTQDGGHIWAEVYPANSSSFKVLAIAPNNPEMIYIGGFGQILKSTDGGDNWQIFSIPGEVQIHSLAIEGVNPNNIYAATGGGILISQDGGNSWRAGRNTDGADMINPFYAVTIAESNNAVYAAGEGDVIYRTSGPDANWQPFVCSGCATAFYALAVKGDNTVYAGGTDARLVRSDNGGSNWQMTNNGIPNSSVPTLNISSIILAPGGDTIYAGTGFSATNANGRGVIRSTDAGNTWTYLELPPGAGSTYHVQSIAVDPDNPDTIFIAGFGGVHKSVDGGQTWIN